MLTHLRIPDFRELNSKYGQNEINNTDIASTSYAGSLISMRLLFCGTTLPALLFWFLFKIQK